MRLSLLHLRFISCLLRSKGFLSQGSHLPCPVPAYTEEALYWLNKVNRLLRVTACTFKPGTDGRSQAVMSKKYSNHPCNCLCIYWHTLWPVWWTREHWRLTKYSCWFLHLKATWKWEMHIFVHKMYLLVVRCNDINLSHFISLWVCIPESLS